MVEELVKLFIVGIFFLIALVFFLLSKIAYFRKPSGRYGVGVIKYHWVDTSRKELNNERGDTYRELVAYVYYPATHKSEKPAKPYDQDALARQKAFVCLKSKIPTILLKGWDLIKTYAQSNVGIAESKYPVVIMSNSANTIVQHYTWLLEELTSQGYIVIGVNHPYIAAITRFPSGQVIQGLIAHKKNSNKQAYEAWKQEQTNTCVADIAFVLTKLEELNKSDTFLQGKLDLAKVGIAGHSFAGDVALLASNSNKSIGVIVNMDGGERVFRYNKILEPFTVPCLMILAERSHQWRDEKGLSDLQTLAAFCREHKQNVSKITLQNVGHGIFGDLPILLNSTLFTRIISHVFDFGLYASASKGCKTTEIIKIAVVDFLDKHLK